MADLYFLPSDAKAGSIYLSKDLDPTKDIVVSFEYSCYGLEPQGDEGFCVFFYDTFAKFLSGGGPGPGLCYTPVFGISANIDNRVVSLFDGVNYGQLGIGFDLTGNFSTTAFGVDGLAEGIPNTITIRGSENASYTRYYTSNSLHSSAFSKPFTLYQQITGAPVEPTFRTVRIRLTDLGKRVIIDFKHPGDVEYTNYVNTTIPETWSNSVNCCLSFATGLTGACFAIKNFNINGIVTTLSATPPQLTTWTYYGARYLGQFPNPTTLTVKDTIIINNASPWDILVPKLIEITPEGAAPFQNQDGYININYGTSALPSIEDSYCNRVGNISEIARQKLFEFIAQLIGWRLWGTMEDGWLFGSNFNAGSGRKAYALKSNTNYVELVSGDSQIFPLWEPNGIRLINDYNPSFPNNFGPRLEVPLWNKKISPPMSIITIVAPFSSTQLGACIFGQTSFGNPAGTHFGTNMDSPLTVNVYNGRGTSIQSAALGSLSLSSYYAIGQTTNGLSAIGYVNNFNTALSSTLVPGCILSAVGFGYDVNKVIPNRQFDGQIVAGFVFNRQIDFTKFFEIFRSTIGNTLIFPTFP